MYRLPQISWAILAPTRSSNRMDKLFAESSRNQKHRTGNFDSGHQQGSVVLGHTWSYEQRVTVAAFIIISGPRMRTGRRGTRAGKSPKGGNMRQWNSGGPQPHARGRDMARLLIACKTHSKSPKREVEAQAKS